MDLNPRHGQVALMNLGSAWANSPGPRAGHEMTP